MGLNSGVDLSQGVPILLLLLFIAGIGAIQLTEESIPSHAILADRVELVCNYDMEGDKLYSVKWYRNGQEFYRYIPTDTPDTTVFPYPGIDVDEYKSTETRIILRRVDLNTSGMFRCEVSGEAPLFQTATSSNVMIVVDLPDEGPVISGSQPRYHTGDVLTANCSSSRSLPAASLKWYINGEEATKRMLVHYPTISLPQGLYSSVLGIKLKVRDKLFSKSGDLKIKCTAAIDTIYWRSNEESIQGLSERSYNLNVRDNGWNSVSAAIPIRSSSPSVSLFPALLGWAFLSTRLIRSPL